MMHRDKYYCAVHDWAAKGPCPRQHDDAMTTYLVHHSWRPGKKNTKTRIWDRRQTRGRVDAGPTIYARIASPLFDSGQPWLRIRVKPSGRITYPLV